MIQLGELMMILELHRQGLSITAIARRTGRDSKTVRKYVERGLEPPVYGPRQVGRPNKLAPYLDYLRERIAAFPDLTAVNRTYAEMAAHYNTAIVPARPYIGPATRVRSMWRFKSRHASSSPSCATASSSRYLP